MSTEPMETSAVKIGHCSWCGIQHGGGLCPNVKAFEYYPDGTIKRVEFKTAKDYPEIVTAGGVGPQITCRYYEPLVNRSGG